MEKLLFFSFKFCETFLQCRQSVSHSLSRGQSLPSNC